MHILSFFYEEEENCTVVDLIHIKKYASDVTIICFCRLACAHFSINFLVLIQSSEMLFYPPRWIDKLNHYIGHAGK